MDLRVEWKMQYKVKIPEDNFDSAEDTSFEYLEGGNLYRFVGLKTTLM